MYELMLSFESLSQWAMNLDQGEVVGEGDSHKKAEAKEKACENAFPVVEAKLRS